MNTSIQALIQKIAEDEKLQEQFEKLETPEEAYELASKLADGFTKEEFLEAVKGFGAYSDDITDEDLAATAGGLDDMKVPDLSINVTMPETVSRPITVMDRVTHVESLSADETISRNSSAPRKAAAI